MAVNDKSARNKSTIWSRRDRGFLIKKKVMQVRQDGDVEDSAASAAYRSLVNDTRGDWVEVCDQDGRVLGVRL